MRPLRWYWWDVRLWIKERREKLVMWLAWHAVPRELRYWITIRACCEATPSNKGPGEVNVIDVLKAFDGRHATS